MHTKTKNFKLNEKILITGGNGFVGKALLKFLRTKKIICISRKKLSPKKNIKFLKADIFNKKTITKILSRERPTKLIHLAWETEPQKYLNKKTNLKWLHASNHLLEKFCYYGGKKALLIGSGLEFDFKKRLLKEENQNLKFNSNLNYYNLTKILFHLNAIKICKNYNIDLTWARIFWLYGQNENQKRLIPNLLKSFKNKKKIIINDTNKIINILNVYDVAKIIALISRKKNLPIVNIANNKNHTLKKIVREIMHILNIKKYKKIIFKNKNKISLKFNISIKSIKNLNYNYSYSLKRGITELAS